MTRSQLSKLRILHLDEVVFVGGQIPTTFGDLLNLEELYLGQMALEGPIPSELGNLKKLRLLDLSRNSLSGPIPAVLGGLLELKALDLSRNELTGTIPAELGELTSLTHFCLHANALEGEIPSMITNLVNLNQNNPYWLCNWSLEGITRLDHNRLYASDPAVLAFLADKSPDWETTQTVAPTNLHVASVYTSSLDLAWPPIAYIQDGGYYEVFTAALPGGPYHLAGGTLSKAASHVHLGGFAPGTSYYFRLRTFTPTHQENQNDLWSEFTPPLGLTFDLVQPEITSTLSITDASETVAVVTAPPGAVTGTVSLGFSSLETVTSTANLAFASLAFELSAYTDGVLQEDFTFVEPVTITIHYTDQDISSLDERDLGLYYRGEDVGAWIDAATTCIPMSVYQRRPEDNILALPICHLSRFGMFAQDRQWLYLPVVAQ